MFADELSRFAAELSERPVRAIAAELVIPPTIAVLGRRGVGRRTVRSALAGAGLSTAPGPLADLVVYVIAEVVKPEDAEAVAACPQPVAVVLNKADLAGGVEAAAARLGTPVLPLSGLWAAAALTDRLDDTLWGALAMLAVEPADPGCTDRFRSGAHRVPAAVRLRLCDVLDGSGITRVLPALRAGSSPDRVRTLLRHASGIDAVVERLWVLSAPLRYRRLLDAVLRLEALAVADGRIGDFLSRDATVLARMEAAAEVIRDAGLTDDDGDTAAGRLRRAARWHRYRRGPVDTLHRACGADIARGALRLWSVSR